MAKRAMEAAKPSIVGQAVNSRAQLKVKWATYHEKEREYDEKKKEYDATKERYDKAWNAQHFAEQELKISDWSREWWENELNQAKKRESRKFRARNANPAEYADAQRLVRTTSKSLETWDKMAERSDQEFTQRKHREQALQERARREDIVVYVYLCVCSCICVFV